MSERMLEIIREAREMAREDEQRPLLDCPVCGNALSKNDRGELDCDVGHFESSGAGQYQR